MAEKIWHAQHPLFLCETLALRKVLPVPETVPPAIGEARNLRLSDLVEKGINPIFSTTMPAISSSTIFNNMRVPKFGALKTKSADSADDKLTLVAPKPNPDEQIYIQRIQKELKRKQPQLVIHGHPAMGPRGAM
ncbi:hypothetical protein BJ742DRAFT_769798 [Cladochytrium replicatum]|nr:hypothetical protein BJ742DRAFT_769798 [Cladochytrium replicatum]